MDSNELNAVSPGVEEDKIKHVLDNFLKKVINRRITEKIPLNKFNISTFIFAP